MMFPLAAGEHHLTQGKDNSTPKTDKKAMLLTVTFGDGPRTRSHPYPLGVTYPEEPLGSDRVAFGRSPYDNVSCAACTSGISCSA